MWRHDLYAIFILRGAGLIVAALLISLQASADAVPVAAASSGKPSASAQPPQTPVPARHFYIGQYRVVGGRHLIPRAEIEKAVYPFLGPYRTEADVESARTALEKAYYDAGFQTVAVQIPRQTGKGGIVMLQVVPEAVGRLRVHGSRYFSIDEIKSEAPALAEGRVPNLTQAAHELVGLNQNPDREITVLPSPGAVPGTVDFDLNVKDTPPVHGSLEINNRYSAFTTPLRINGSFNYDNLWQLGHSIGASFQLSPEELSEVKVFSGYYLARVPGVDWLSLELEGTDQDSNVSTLGGIGVAGRGDVIGARAIIDLPHETGFYQSLSLGVDYKRFDNETQIAGVSAGKPVTYAPFSAAYSGIWSGKGYETDADLSLDMDFRGIGSDEDSFEQSRYGSSADFAYLRGDISHQRDLPEGFQGYAKVQGQVSSAPLINSEQFSGGGIGTVRGYLESEELGDNGLLGSVELRMPSLTSLLGKEVDEWRFYVFGEGGILAIDHPLPEQEALFSLASVGVGTRFKFAKHFNGSLDFGLPLLPGAETQRYNPLLTFRVWADF